jgi:hypothetical protein
MNKTTSSVLAFGAGVLAVLLALKIPPGKVDFLDTATVNILLSSDGKSCTLDRMPVSLDSTTNRVRWVPPTGYTVFSVEFPNEIFDFGTPFYDPNNGVWLRYFNQGYATTPPAKKHAWKDKYPIQKITLTDAAGKQTVCYDQGVAGLDPMKVIINQ